MPNLKLLEQLRLVASRPYALRTYSSQHLEEVMSHYNERARLIGGNDAKLQAYILDKYKGKFGGTDGLKLFKEFEDFYHSTTPRRMMRSTEV